MVEVAGKKMASYLAVKSEIDKQIGKVNVRIEHIRKTIINNTRCIDNPEGVLTQKKEDYMECFELKT